jgi:hypothetical protein
MVKGESILMRLRHGLAAARGAASGVAIILALASLSLHAQQKPAAKGGTAGGTAAAAAKAPVKGPPRGPVEKYDCKIGTEDQHARIAIQAQGGEVQSVAYYSKWKPRTCSVHLQRNDAFSQWKDTGDATTITTEHGDFLIQVSRSEYQLFFREVDRMHYCGMMGKLNGSMTVTRGPKRQCSVEGIMDRNDSEPVHDKEEAAKSAGASGDTAAK